MDIGTAKPSAEERRRVPHHMIDIREPEEEFNAGDYQREARAVLEDSAPAMAASCSCRRNGALSPGVDGRVVCRPEAIRPFENSAGAACRSATAVSICIACFRNWIQLQPHESWCGIRRKSSGRWKSVWRPERLYPNIWPLSLASRCLDMISIPSA